MTQILMPKATAIWLIDNTSLTFEQIANVCNLHPLEIQGIADGDVAHGVVGFDPIKQLDREEIKRCENDPQTRLQLRKPKIILSTPKRKHPRYTPISKRQERPNAINWLIRHHPELSDGDICKLAGTTKPTIQTIRTRTHWNIASLKYTDPVGVGLCTQSELDGAILAARARQEQKRKKALAEQMQTAKQNAPQKQQSAELTATPGSIGAKREKSGQN